MARKTVLAMAMAGALALVAYSMSSVPAVATGVQMNSGLSGLAVRNADDANLVLVGRKGGGDGGKGRGAGRGDGGGGKQGMSRHEGGAKQGMPRHEGGSKGYARHEGGGKQGMARHEGGGKSHAKRGGGRTVVVYRNGHRYWHNRQIWWWGPLVYSYDPCIRWVRFCPGCPREPINICY